jgi:hypothetical protein
MFVALGVLGGAALFSACEDDSLYKAGPATFQNDVLDGGAAGAGGAADAGPWEDEEQTAIWRATGRSFTRITVSRELAGSGRAGVLCWAAHFGPGEISMVIDRLPTAVGRTMRGLAMIAGLAVGAGVLAGGCTNSEGSTIAPKRPFPDASADAAGSGTAGADGAAGADGGAGAGGAAGGGGHAGALGLGGFGGLGGVVGAAGSAGAGWRDSLDLAALADAR